MKYMLDTNICIYAIKNKPPEVIRNFLRHDPDDMCISSITYGYADCRSCKIRRAYGNN